MAEAVHPVLVAIRPLLDRIGAVVVGPAELRGDDVPLAWDGVVIAGIRLAGIRLGGIRLADIQLADRTSTDRPDEHSRAGDAARGSADPATGPAGGAGAANPVSAASPTSPADRAGPASAASPAADPVEPVQRQPDPALPRVGVPADDSDVPGGLDGIIVELERSLGTPLAELSRTGKQQAVRLLEESGAFSYRKSVEVVATALGVSRFTVYNYLNRDRD